MPFIASAVGALLVFGVTIFVHELGHFWAARRHGLVVERFAIGFGPKIISWKRDGVDYSINWIPFGGYVALPQMAPMEMIEGKSDKPTTELPPHHPVVQNRCRLLGTPLQLSARPGLRRRPVLSRFQLRRLPGNHQDWLRQVRHPRRTRRTAPRRPHPFHQR
ncbi:MAG: site-2 protease family protein [Bdellovibrionaceae bacterium]|nr:site-2 protease family protein [Pseudobdellovibrionaceae bacterium]